MRITQRAQAIEPFYVMEIAKAAALQEASMQGAAKSTLPPIEHIIRLNIGEPDFTAAPLVQESAYKAIRGGVTQYTHATGLEELRELISQWYLDRFNLSISPKRIVITAGASAALQLVCLALIEAGDEILMPDPCYPCNRQFVQAAGGASILIPTSPESRFQLNLEHLHAHWGDKTRGLLLASPSNPTATSIDPSVMREMVDFALSKSAIVICDEIYLGLSYDKQFGQSALALSDQVISVNSFSKYFNMTGWRLGWMVVPTDLVSVIERLAQNLYICPSTIAQHAAKACFDPQSIALFEQRRAEFKSRRDFFIPALKSVGLDVPVTPDGAFYAWADCSKLCKRLGLESSWELAFEILKKAHVAVAPGRDFGVHGVDHFLRFSTASSRADLEEAIARLGHWLSANP
jgi:aspartate/methionine/tyrosine aminotransferase